MRIRLSYLVLVGLIAISVSGCAASVRYCTGNSPADVLEFYSNAIINRDMDALRGLYADNFVYVLGGTDDATTWGRGWEIDATTKLFAAVEAETPLMVFSGDYSVAPGEEPDTWVLDNVRMSMSVSISGEGGRELTTSDARHRLTVKKLAEPLEHYALIKWEAPR